jgi:RHS repeat-associated protein
VHYNFELNITATGKLDNKYQYGGKELQDKEFSDGSGLALLDFGARLLDPQLGRFWQIDPKGELFQPYTPYNYCLNSPVLFVDPDGMQAKYNWCTGRYQENGRDVSWEDVKASNGFGEYASTVSVFLTKKYEDDTKQKLKNDAHNSLFYELNYFIAASKGNTSSKIIQAEDENDAADQIEKINQYVDNIFISSHGSKEYANFSIGKTYFFYDYEIRNSQALERIGKKIYHANTPFKGMPLATVTVAACYVSSLKAGGESLLKALADKLYVSVLGASDLCYPSHFDGKPSHPPSTWKLFLPGKLTGNSIWPIPIRDVYFDNSARPHYTVAPNL